jgi:hypothetical protein
MATSFWSDKKSKTFCCNERILYRGEPGLPGPQGPTGSNSGFTGATGPTGLIGETGATGESGASILPLDNVFTGSNTFTQAINGSLTTAISMDDFQTRITPSNIILTTTDGSYSNTLTATGTDIAGDNLARKVRLSPAGIIITNNNVVPIPSTLTINSTSILTDNWQLQPALITLNDDFFNQTTLSSTTLTTANGLTVNGLTTFSTCPQTPVIPLLPDDLVNLNYLQTYVPTNLLGLNNTWTDVNTFTQPIVGDLSGNASTSTTASNATNVITASSNVAAFLPLALLSTATAGSTQIQVDSNNQINYNPSTSNLTATTFTGALNGNAATATLADTATNALACSGNAATATTATNALACSGNAATATLADTATNALACSGNAATATTATNALACSGNAATATTATNALACSGNAATATLADTATNALACSGNAATATTATNALACSGNAATATLADTATNSLACSGTAATATTATNALACSGNAATATLADTATNALACSGTAANANNVNISTAGTASYSIPLMVNPTSGTKTLLGGGSITFTPSTNTLSSLNITASSSITSAVVETTNGGILKAVDSTGTLTSSISSESNVMIVKPSNSGSNTFFINTSGSSAVAVGTTPTNYGGSNTGLGITWNTVGGSGATDFVNYAQGSGVGLGGFNFFSGSTSNPIASIGYIPRVQGNFSDVSSTLIPTYNWVNGTISSAIGAIPAPTSFNMTLIPPSATNTYYGLWANSATSGSHPINNGSYIQLVPNTNTMNITSNLNILNTTTSLNNVKMTSTPIILAFGNNDGSAGGGSDATNLTSSYISSTGWTNPSAGLYEITLTGVSHSIFSATITGNPSTATTGQRPQILTSVVYTGGFLNAYVSATFTIYYLQGTGGAGAPANGAFNYSIYGIMN